MFHKIQTDIKLLLDTYMWGLVPGIFPELVLPQNFKIKVHHICTVLLRYNIYQMSKPQDGR